MTTCNGNGEVRVCDATEWLRLAEQSDAKDTLGSAMMGKGKVKQGEALVGKGDEM